MEYDIKMFELVQILQYVLYVVGTLCFKVTPKQVLLEILEYLQQKIYVGVSF